MWKAISVSENEIHIVPHLDVIEHAPSESCVCGPKTNYYPQDDLKLVYHAALDSRKQLITPS